MRPAQPIDLIILTSILLMEALSIKAMLLQSHNCEGFISGFFVLCMAAFMSGLGNMREITGVSSCKFAYSNKKVISSDYNI